MLHAIRSSLFTAALAALALSASGQTVHHVDAAATGANNGTSWADAYVDLQTPLGTASAGHQIWVAAGIYKPAPIGSPPSSTFALPSGVEVYGGFAGWETALSQRDPGANVTTLSGDLAGNDTYTPIFNVGGADNAWQVVTLSGTSASTRLDGFHVIGGHFHNAPWAAANGAGIFVTGGGGTIANTEVSYCVANEGGAIYTTASTVLVEDCDLHNNYAVTAGFAGGALATAASGSVTVRDTAFTSNLADGVGLSDIAGGALAVAGGTTVTVERCSFDYNVARNRQPGFISFARGGAIYNYGTLIVRESTFKSNTSNSGGALFTWSGKSTTILNSRFTNNWVTKYVLSGGIEGGGDGGTIIGGTGLVITGCLVYGGSADNTGGVSAGAGIVSSSIFWGNTDDKGDIGISQVKADEVRYSCVENMLVGEPGEDPPDPKKFPGSTAADPLFVNPLGGDFHVSAGSPVIDAAENPAWPTGSLVDLDGAPRFLDDPVTADTGVGPPPVADMGPYEFGNSLVASYCTAGTSASGCNATLFASGTPSATAASGFVVDATGIEGSKDGLFFFGANGRQANPWGNGTSFQCVTPPVSRGGLLSGSGTPGQCDGSLSQDLNARWTAKPAQNPGAGAVVQTQLWYRDPQSTSNQTTSLSDALEYTLAP